MNTPVWRLLDPVASSYLLFYNQNFIIGTQTGFSFGGDSFFIIIIIWKKKQQKSLPLSY
jgi:hypothetical protein